MSSQIVTQPITKAQKPRGGYRGRGGPTGGSANRPAKANGRNNKDKSKAAQGARDEEGAGEQATNTVSSSDAAVEVGTDDAENVCWICAEPVKYYAVPECNHRTCHMCALRLRALYKKMDCTFCKEPQTIIIFSVSPDASFSSYTPESIPYHDAKLSISFETQEMMEDTLIILRFNCPDDSCDYIGNGWGDLRLHTRAVHGKLMCDLCIRFKKVFAHEHALYPPNVLPVHLPSMYQRPHQKSILKDQVEGGIHPLCEFCRECFFSTDELYTHMRERHEECFVCKRNEIRDQYFLNYESLEKHFNSAHHPCTNSQCLARKFVVFNTPLDLQAHMVDEHGADMSSRDKKVARTIQAEFAFEEVGHGGRHGRRGIDREREREPPPRAQQPPPPGPSRPPSGIGSTTRRREVFGASLTVDDGSNVPSKNVTPHQSRPPSPPREDLDPATAERHALFINRLQSLAANPTGAVPAVKAAIRGYRASESSARDFISTIWNVLDRNLEHTASIINSFVDLLDEEEKKQDLLSSWNGFAIEQRRQFPDLVPTAVGSGYSGIASGRVLNAKHSTNTRSAQRSSRQVWDRVAQAASSSHSQALAALRPKVLALSSSTPANTPAFRQLQRVTPWSSTASGNRVGGTSTPPSDPRPYSVNMPSSSPGANTPRQAPPKLTSAALFPELPSSAAVKSKPPVGGNASLRNILGTTPQAVSVWQAGSGGGSAAAGANSSSGETQPPVGGGGGHRDETGNRAPPKSTTKGKKGKQKQTLFTLGSFPT